MTTTADINLSMLPASTAAPSAHAIPIAIISNGLTPYRTALHRRIVRELQGISLWSVFTHEISNAAWAFEPPADIRPELFGKGEHAIDQSKPSRAIHEWRKGGEIIRWLSNHQIEAVLLEGYNDPGRLRIIRWCEQNHVPCLMWGDSNIRGDLSSGLPAALKRVLLKRVLRKCTVVLACGSGGREYFAKYGVPDDRIFYYPYEPDYQLIKDLPAAAITAAQSRFRLAAGRRRLVFSGRLIEVKRPELVIQAFVAIAAARPEWDLVMMGDGKMRATLHESVPVQLRQRVIWTGFVGEQETVSAVYRCCDVLVLPSDYEPWALVVNEAAAAGLAIIASDVVGAAAELVREGINGYCFPAGDQKALVRVLLQATDSSAIDRLKHGSSAVLADWRRRGDPVAGLRQALEKTGVLPTKN